MNTNPQADALIQRGRTLTGYCAVPRSPSQRKSDFAEAYAAFCQAAEAGSREAHFWIGRAFESGWGVKPDAEMAVKAFNRGIDTGCARSMLRLAEILREHTDNTADCCRAFSLIQKASELGLADAQFELGLYYSTGEQTISLGQNHELAVSSFQKAADQDHNEAQAELALCYFFGRGVACDFAKAVYYLNRSTCPDIHASLLMVHCLARGLGTQQDVSSAVKLLLERRLNPLWCGAQYQHGEWPTPRDLSLAYSGYRVAIERNDPLGREYLRKLLPFLTKSELMLGERLFGAMGHRVLSPREVSAEILLGQIFDQNITSIAVALMEEADLPALDSLLALILKQP